MKTDENAAIRTRRAMVAHDAAIVARAKARTKFPTTDANASARFSWNRGRFRDTVINAETTPRNPDMVGRAWSSNIKAELDSMSTADRKIRLGEMRKIVDSYAQNIHMGAMGPGNAGSLATVGDEPFLGSGADPQSVNDANRAFWDKANKHVAGDVRPFDATGAAIQDMQRAIDKFYDQQTAHQRRPEKEWGKG